MGWGKKSFEKCEKVHGKFVSHIIIAYSIFGYRISNDILLFDWPHHMHLPSTIGSQLLRIPLVLQLVHRDGLRTFGNYIKYRLAFADCSN